MGELEEKETPTTATTSPQQEVAEEPKETDKMLEKKDETEAEATAAATAAAAAVEAKASSPNADKKSLSSKPLASSSKTNSPTGDKKKSASNAALDQEESAADLLKKPNGNSGEEIIDIPSDVATAAAANENDDKKISKEEREVKPKKIPIGGLKLPGFFMKSKPKPDGDGADGELLEKEHKEDAAAAAEGDAAGAGGDGGAAAKGKKDDKPSLSERLRNFFVRKPAAEKQQQQQQAAAAKQQNAANGDAADNKSEATAEATPAEGNNENIPAVAVADNPPQKRGLLNAIKLPIANILPRKKADPDVEMGIGKAGLASMETLDDSLKDQDCVDKAPAKNNGTEEVSKLKKSASGEIKEAAAAGVDEKSPEDIPPTISVFDRLRGYRCSVDDALIALGILLFVLLIAVIGYVLSHETLTSPPIRDGRFIDAATGCGMVEGLKDDGSFAFRGIPYAKPPIGENRWRPAQLIESIDDCWNDTLRAHNTSAYCVQRLGNGTIIGDEDCLYLDVITRQVRYDNPLPVIVLIGAESLIGPSPGILRPSARYAHSHDVVFVRPNFRLGVFGFLALKELTQDAYPHTSGNYALTDIIAALKWVKLNIAHFGGDPKSVILLGHRAGATLVSALVTSKLADDLYSRAWVSSSSAIFPGKPLQESEKRNEEIMRALECVDVKCLRTTSSERIWAATPDTWQHFPNQLPTKDEQPSTHHEWLVLDGHILQEHLADAWKKEKTDDNNKPRLVMGTTAHESHTEKLRQLYANWTEAEVREFIENSQIGALKLTDEAIRRYNATNYRAVAAMITDIRTICPLLINARLKPNMPFYVVTQGNGGADQLATVESDVLAILGRYESHTVAQRRFVSSMQQLFYYYVSHGTVPQFDPRRRVIQVGQDALPKEDHENCNFWISNDIVPRYARVD